ncbi:hypothetical protein PIIN_09179 [Serendipita indica DSM 11827]|uniref:Transmembrane protein n=1 Tax=Serendipita indica (strain DSM 11827) TaxID=1109443 RepID=G4TV52_SERID|nr:hypothetical protein PIIN_09179 [Serendipita indica DSM 11827]
MFASNLLSFLFLYGLIARVAYAGRVHFDNKPQVRVTTSFVNFYARIMDQWGDGGGKTWVISSDSSHPFVGRQFGGAKRTSIRGTNAFGSGYPYGVNDASTVAGRPFPFGVWPLWWPDDFMGSDEVGPHLDGIRPGGHISIVELKANKEEWSKSNDETFFALGDSQSLLSTLVSYVTWCHTSRVWPVRFDPRLQNATVKLENVLRYYRAGSFALAHPTYTNPSARNATSQGTTSLPDGIQNSRFWQCLDEITASALPIMNPPPDNRFWRVFPLVYRFTYWLMFIIGCAALYLLAITIAKLRDILWNCDLIVGDWMQARRESKAQTARDQRPPSPEYETYP